MTRAFAALLQERRDFELRPWLFRIAHNEAVSALRRRRRADEPLDERAEGAGALDEQVALGAELEALRGDLGALPERQRSALVLRELNGLSHAEIGQALGATPQLVKQSIFQARTALMQAREGREMACADVRRALSDGDGRVLRGTRIRAHLRACASCRRFHEDLERRPRELALLAPPLSPAAGAALLERLLPATGAGASTAAGTAALLGPKTAATLAILAAAAGGGAVARDEHPAAPAPAQPVAAETSIARATPSAAGSAASPLRGTPSAAAAAPGRPPWAGAGASVTRSKPPSAARGAHGKPPWAARGAHGKPAWAGTGASQIRGKPPWSAPGASPAAGGTARDRAKPAAQRQAATSRPADRTRPATAPVRGQSVSAATHSAPAVRSAPVRPVEPPRTAARARAVEAVPAPASRPPATQRPARAIPQRPARARP